MKHSRTSVLFVVPYPLKRAPSQRFRVEQFFPVLEDAGIHYRVESFLTESGWQALYRSGSAWQKILAVGGGFFRRFLMLFSGLSSYDFVFLHREATPVGPPLIEWLLAKVWHKRILYDYDDAIWMPDPSGFNRAGWLKNYGKVGRICSWSYRVIGGNEFLCAFARKQGAAVTCIPTVLDEHWGNGQVKQHGDHRPVVGWTGSFTTLFYLNELVSVLQKLERELSFDFLVIADQDPTLPLKNYRFVPWKRESEREDLLRIDIGVMPLTNNSWSEGKCGFKLIQYYSVGIPAIASSVGVNKQIISSASIGFLCSTPEEWEQALRQLIGSVALRAQMGAKGRENVMDHYSVRAQRDNFLGLFSRGQ